MSSLMALAVASRTPENLLRLARAANRAAWRTGQMLAGGLLDHYSQDTPGHSGARLCGLLGGAVPPIYARGRWPIFAASPLTHG